MQSTKKLEFRVGDGGDPETFTKISSMTAVTGLGGGGRSEQEISTFDSDAKEFFLGLIDNGTISLSGIFQANDALQSQLENDANSDVSRNYEVALPSGIKWSFSGRISKFEMEFPVDGVARFNSAVRLSGSVTRVNP